eukprot:jgi/Tetstr1/436730/TSEL_025513.t1
MRRRFASHLSAATSPVPGLAILPLRSLFCSPPATFAVVSNTSHRPGVPTDDVVVGMADQHGAPPQAEDMHPMYIKDYNRLREMAEEWCRARAEGRQLEVLPAEEADWWLGWLQGSLPQAGFPQAAYRPPSENEPPKKEGKEPQKMKDSNTSLIVVLLVVVLVLGAAVSACFAFSYAVKNDALEQRALAAEKKAAVACSAAAPQAAPTETSSQQMAEFQTQLANAKEALALAEREVASTNAGFAMETQRCDNLANQVEAAILEAAQAREALLSAEAVPAIRSLITGQPVPAENAAAYSTSGAYWRWDFTLYTSGAVVRYRDQPTALSFNATSRTNWKAAVLPAGFGTGYAWNTPLDQATTNGNYVIFLTSFCLTDAQLARLADAKMFLFVARDDNAVVQLNGVNIMDEPQTQQSEMVYWNEVIEVPATRLVSGRNVIKAALTNIGQSAEAGFDADLRVVNGPALQLTDFC